MNFKGKDYVIHVAQRLAGIDKCMDNSCKQGAEYLYRSLVIVYMERGQWQASFIWEKSACFTEVSVTEHINFQIPRNPGGTGHVQTVCIRLFFSPPTHEAWARG